MNLSKCQDLDFVKRVIFEDWESASSDGMNKGSFEPDKYEWLQMESNGRRIGLWSFEAKSNICASIHLYMLKEFRADHWNTVCEPMIEFVKHNTPIKVLVAEIPSNRKNTILCALKGGFTELSRIPNSVVECGELADILIFTRVLTC